MYWDAFTERSPLLALTATAPGQELYRRSEQHLRIEPDRVVADIEEAQLHLLLERCRPPHRPGSGETGLDRKEAGQPRRIGGTPLDWNRAWPDETHSPPEHAAQLRKPI